MSNTMDDTEITPDQNRKRVCLEEGEPANSGTMSVETSIKYHKNALRQKLKKAPKNTDKAADKSKEYHKESEFQSIFNVPPVLEDEIHRYDKMHVEYAAYGFTPKCQSVLRRITQSEAIPAEFKARFPLFKILSSVARQLCLNELEVLVYSRFLKKIGWMIGELTDEACDAIRFEVPNSIYVKDYIALNLHLLCVGYLTKEHMNDRNLMQCFNAHVKCRLAPQFDQLYYYWYQTNQMKVSFDKFDLPEINELFRLSFEEFDAHAESGPVRGTDYNDLVDKILEMSHAYCIDKTDKPEKPEKAEKEKEKAEKADKKERSTKDRKDSEIVSQPLLETNLNSHMSNMSNLVLPLSANPSQMVLETTGDPNLNMIPMKNNEHINNALRNHFIEMFRVNSLEEFNFLQTVAGGLQAAAFSGHNPLNSLSLDRNYSGRKPSIFEVQPQKQSQQLLPPSMHRNIEVKAEAVDKPAFGDGLNVKFEDNCDDRSNIKYTDT